MKKITNILVSVLVLATIAACGASPRPGRSNLSSDADAALPTISSENADSYELLVGSLDGSTTALYSEQILCQQYGICPANFGIPTGTGATGAFISVKVDKTAGTCGLYVAMGCDATSATAGVTDGENDAYAFLGTIVNSVTTTSLTCMVIDGASTISIIIGSATATSAYVTIMDAYGSTLVNMRSFTYVPANAN